MRAPVTSLPWSRFSIELFLATVFLKRLYKHSTGSISAYELKARIEPVVKHYVSALAVAQAAAALGFKVKPAKASGDWLVYVDRVKS